MKKNFLFIVVLLLLSAVNLSFLLAQEMEPAKEEVKEEVKKEVKEEVKNEAKADTSFPLKDGDKWVMLGDSITAQKLHTNYFEAFCFARYQKLNFCFRNSGVGGDTITSALARFDWDVAAWAPTVVSVELGMNDKNASTAVKYIENMGKLNEKIKAIPARAIYFTASPVNNGDTSDNLTANGRLNEFANSLKEFASAQNAVFADQFHELLDIWGKNKPREASLSIKKSIEPFVNIKNLAGAEHLKAYLAEIAKDTQPIISMEGDPVHPGAPGQLMMAAALLKSMNADGFVSSAALDATGKVTESKGCVIENAKAEKEVLTFTRLDESVPFPIPDTARSVLPLYPTILDLSQYTLTITGLTAEKYSLKINKILVATITTKEFEAGINLTQYNLGPIANQSKAILAAVNSKEMVVTQWRTASKASVAPTANEEAKQKVEALAKSAEEADAKIRLAAKPILLTFEIAPAK